MDVDSDLDSQLLQQLRCMGTQDRDVLVADFKRLMGSGLSDQCCTFYLDMADWNLQEAINAYCDLQQAGVNYAMTLVRDVTVGDGQEVSPNTKFCKTWRLRNSGTESWPPACCLRQTQGAQLGGAERVMVAPLQPGQETDVLHELLAPAQCGLYQAQWRMSTPTGTLFGEPVWVIIQVTEDGLLGVTQQLSRIGPGSVGSPPPRLPASNPFEKANPFQSAASAAAEGGFFSVPMRPAGEPGLPHAGSLPSEIHGPLGLALPPSRSDPDLSSGEAFSSLGLGTPDTLSQAPQQFPVFGSPGINGHLQNGSQLTDSNGIHDEDEDML